MARPSARDFEDYTSFFDEVIDYVRNEEAAGRELSKVSREAKETMGDWEQTWQQIRFFQTDLNSIGGALSYPSLLNRLAFMRDERTTYSKR